MKKKKPHTLPELALPGLCVDGLEELRVVELDLRGQLGKVSADLLHFGIALRLDLANLLLHDPDVSRNLLNLRVQSRTVTGEHSVGLLEGLELLGGTFPLRFLGLLHASDLVQR